MDYRQTRSANSYWLSVQHGLVKARPTTTFRIVDNTNDHLPKRVVVCVPNVDGGDTPPYWQNITVNDKAEDYFTLLGPNTIRATINSVELPSTLAVANKIYTADSSSTAFAVSDGGGGSFQVANSDSTYDMEVSVYRRGNVIATATVAAGDSQDFSFRPTFYIGATTDLGNPPAFEDLNTEISALGVATADIVIGKMSTIYVFTLANITLA